MNATHDRLPKPSTLLLTGSPPGTRLVGEIVLRDLALVFGPDNMRCFAITSPKFVHSPDERLASMPLVHERSALVRARRRGTSKLAALESHASYRFGFGAEVSRLVDRIIAEAGNVEQVLAVLDNALMFALAHRVAARLRVALVTLVWDSPGYLLRQAGFDRWSRAALLREFSRSLAASSRVGVVSEAMRAEFATMTDSPILTFRHGTAPVESAPSARQPDRGEWLICFAGSMYAPCAWRAFQAALDLRNWHVAGRPVRLRILAGQIELRSQARARVEFLGVCDEDEMRSALSNCDLAYLPQPFSPHLRDVSRFSFPTKLSNYLALGLPVFVHSPPEAAVSEFILENPCGGYADSLDPEAIASSLDAIFADVDGLAAAREAALRLAAREFSDASFREAVANLVGGRDETAAARGAMS